MSQESRAQILVVDDEPSIREFLQIMLKREKMQVEVAENGKQALEIYKRNPVDLVISDLQMPEMNGIELLSQIKSLNPEVPVMMITAFGTTETAVEAMKLGAFDYLSKPFKIDDVKIRIQKALQNRTLVLDNLRLKSELGERYSFSNIVGSSEPMRKVFDLIKRVAPTNSNVLITGESGTGKELIAKAIHYNSSYKDSPFVAVNCGAIPEELMESEFFGHKKGAFTSAVADKKGYFEIANGGTLFLDEIGELPLNMQATLLRTISDGNFFPVGGTEPVHSKVRLVSATNKNLEEAIQKKLFREDLYFRLNVINIHTPPLRTRREDITHLAQYFLEKYSDQFGKQTIKSLPKDVLDLLRAYPWPGNVRELENVVERMVALSGEQPLTLESIPDHIREPMKPKFESLGKELSWNAAGVKLDEILDKVEKEFILKAFEQAKNNRRDAARLLNVTMRSLRYRLEKFGMDVGGGDSD